MNKACTEYAHRHTNKPLETRKNQNELLLQEDALIFLLHSEHINYTLKFYPITVYSCSLIVIAAIIGSM